MDDSKNVWDKFHSGVPFNQWLQQYMERNMYSRIQELLNDVKFSKYNPTLR